MIEDEKSYAVKYLEYMDMEERGETFDDFFDWLGVPVNQRNDFVVAAILKQAAKIQEAQNHVPT